MHISSFALCISVPRPSDDFISGLLLASGKLLQTPKCLQLHLTWVIEGVLWSFYFVVAFLVLEIGAHYFDNIASVLQYPPLQPLRTYGSARPAACCASTSVCCSIQPACVNKGPEDQISQFTSLFSTRLRVLKRARRFYSGWLCDGAQAHCVATGEQS